MNKEDFAPQQQVQPRLFASPLQHQQMIPQQQQQPQPQPIVYSQPQVPVEQQRPQQPLIQQMYYSPQLYPSIQENSYPVVPDGPLLASQSILQHEESVSFMLFALGFACNLIWLVSFLKYKSSPSPMARKYAKWSRNAFIITAVLVIISTILWFGLVLVSGRMLVGGGHRHHHHPTPGEGEHPHEPHEPGRPDDHRKPGDHPRHPGQGGHPGKPHPDQPDQPANPEDHRKPEDRPAHPHEKPSPEQNNISYLNGGLLENIRMGKTPEDRMQIFQNMINRVKEQGDLLAVPETAELQVKDLPLMAGKKE